jgi:minor extracellular serine protease Vpr
LYSGFKPRTSVQSYPFLADLLNWSFVFMLRTVLFLLVAGLAAAQTIPGRYIIELKTSPAAAVTAAKKTHYSPADAEVQARRVQIQAEHQAMEAKIQVLGGKVTDHYDTLLNGMAVTMTEQSAAQVRQMPEVKNVYPVQRHHLLMDQAINVHRITQAWQSLPGGQASAGAGIKIGILDCGVDNTHPAFSNFATPLPSGFPIFAGGLATAGNVNNKVIVTRVYSDVAGGIDNTQTDGNDYCQHGTTIAGISAGLQTDPGVPTMVAPFSGVAPGAWIGNYKVAEDTVGGSDDVTFLHGLEDAVSDGMNVVNYSSGSLIYGISDETGADASAIAQAVANGVLVVAAAGNSGPSGAPIPSQPGLGSISSPAATPAAIAVGAMENQRWFWYAATIGGHAYYAVPADEELGVVTGDTTGAVVDVATLTSDKGGYACSSLPANSLQNSIALIQRGSPTSSSCTFQTKLNNAQGAGAVGAIVYDNTSRSFFDYTMSGVSITGFQLGLSAPPTDSSSNDRAVSWSIGTANLPSVMVSQADGMSIKQSVAAASSLSADLDFDGKTALSYPANTIADFSSLGPTPLGNVKPDVLAVGDWLVAPSTTQYEVSGCAAISAANNCYSPYTLLDSSFTLNYFYGFGYGQLFDDGAGTSFATPIVTGSIAVLMAAKPGLSAAQYRSLITNGAAELDLYPGSNIAFPQYAGAGKLDLLGSLGAGLTAVPATVNFAPPTVSTGGSTSSVGLHTASRKDSPAAGSGASETVNLTNVGASDTFSVVVNSIDGVATPTVDSTSFSLAAGASKTITISLPGAGSLAAGQYHGFVVISGSKSQTPLRLPYWYGIAGSATNALGLYVPSTDAPSCTDYIDFRLLDASGMPVTTSGTPTVTTTSPRAVVVSVYPVSDFLGNYAAGNYVPGTFEAQITTGRPDTNGTNVFTISSGSFNASVAVTIDTSGATACNFSSTAATTGTNSQRSASKLTGTKKILGLDKP